MGVGKTGKQNKEDAFPDSPSRLRRKAGRISARGIVWGELTKDKNKIIEENQAFIAAVQLGEMQS